MPKNTGFNKIKMFFVEKFSEGDKDKQLQAMRKYFEFTDLKEAQVIYVASILFMEKAMTLRNISNKPVAVYCWDYYLWAHEGHHHDGNNWKEYAKFLQEADVVFAPSEAQQLRLKELLDVDSIVVHSGILTYDAKSSDKRFVLDPVRYYPEEQAHWVEKACEELGIKCIHSEHQFSLKEFRKLVTTCSFMITALHEASTGGLTLMEGLWHGKPSIVSDSKYMGASDYVGKYGIYVKDGEYEDLKAKIKTLWENPIEYDKEEVRKYIKNNYSFDIMAKGLYNGIKSIL